MDKGGFVRLVDTMPREDLDEAIVQAARVSYADGTKSTRSNEGLIRYLMRHRHSTPFEMAELKFAVRVPMDCWRQWVRHRTANINEYSTRYSEAIDSASVTGASGWREQSKSNNQGSDGYLGPETGKMLSKREAELLSLSREVYNERLACGVAREQARKDLPLSTYTEAYWKVDLHNLLHFLSLRMDSHAQQEIRAYATTIGENIVKPLFPLVWEAFEDYRLGGMFLTKLDVECLAKYISGEAQTPESAVKHIENKREQLEALDKLKRITDIVADKVM